MPLGNLELQSGSDLELLGFEGVVLRIGWCGTRREEDFVCGC